MFSSFFSFLCQAMLILHPLLSVFVMPTPELHFCVTFGSFLFLHNALFFPLSVFCYHSLLPWILLLDFFLFFFWILFFCLLLFLNNLFTWSASLSPTLFGHLFFWCLPYTHKGLKQSKESFNWQSSVNNARMNCSRFSLFFIFLKCWTFFLSSLSLFFFLPYFVNVTCLLFFFRSHESQHRLECWGWIIVLAFQKSHVSCIPSRDVSMRPDTSQKQQRGN